MSDASAVDPEAAFVASLSSCHMLWFLSIAAKAGFAVRAYRDHATGETQTSDVGKRFIGLVTLHPEVRWAGEREPSADEIAHLHERAHEECFIANSVKTEIRIEVLMRSPTGIPIWQVDAFADRPFTGNPAAVCILERYPSDAWMQHVAAEMNLSETAFLVPTDEANGFHLRWFTPAGEVDLCGHATLAAAQTLIEPQKVDADRPIRFQTRSGELTCTRTESGITLDFPATPAIDDVDPKLAESLLGALGVREGKVLRSQFDLLAIVKDANVVASLHPNFNALEALDFRGVMVSAASGKSGIDFVSRFFAPQCGINEDPVTGSAHCCLAPYWAERIGKNLLVGYQASSRGGTVHCEVAGDRVRLTGTAVTVMEGQLLNVPS